MEENAPFENPLIPNARLRQMYLAMMRLRTVEHSLDMKDRSGALGREACLIAASIDLGAGDLISDAFQGPAIRFLRGHALHRALDPKKRSRRRPVFAECGTASTLPHVPPGTERLWSVLGAAGALNARYCHSGGHRGVVLAYIRSSELKAPTLRKVLEFATDHVLPILFLVAPKDIHRPSPGEGKLSELARRSGIPGIVTDAADAVAIYRVAQESLGRARAGGGSALIECVPFVLHGTEIADSRQTNGALAAIERYILERHIVTTDWIDRETRGFARQLPQPVH